MSEFAAFWSYVHEDDDAEGGRIRALATFLEKRVQLLTGSAFSIFIDSDSLAWGDEWADRIDEALVKTTFFVPVVTPRYFQSASCREELIKYSTAAKRTGLTELIMPIHYVTVSGMDSAEHSGDELVDLMRTYQWEDFREVALEDPNSSNYRKAVQNLATQLIDRAKTADSKPASLMAKANEPQAQEALARNDDLPVDDDTGPGLADVLADGETALTQFAEIFTELGPLIEGIGNRIEQATADVEANDKKGKGFAGRILVFRRLASELDEPVDSVETLAHAALDRLLTISPMMTLLMQLLRSEPTQIAETIPTFVDPLQSMVASAEEGLASAEQMAEEVGRIASMSKDLRPPARRLERSLRQLVDTRTLFRSWSQEAGELRALAAAQKEAISPSGGS
ncbi:MAG TPA: toll/interleukin-1 receptor domain-containing protein [Acidimicrobiales bacterium]|nr:toll/interleukin-1 receptor domain-containing protein [Acidimicrobiales bacterium]